MVHSVIAASDTGRVKRDFFRENPSSSGTHEQNGVSFSQVLQKEVEEIRTDSIDCHTITYGNDRKLHPFDYWTREYHY